MKAGAELQAGVPLLAKLFASFSAAFKANATYKEELRRVIRNTFAQLAEAFNFLVAGAEKKLAEARGQTVRILFVVDGTDKLREEDRRRLFVEDADLLLAVRALAVYTAPIALKYEDGSFGRLDADLVLPMVKLQDQDDARFEAGWRAMRDILLKRADRSLFATDDEVDTLVANSGGHPRELLRLLQICCEIVDEWINSNIVRRAVAQLASEYRRLLEPDDYALLARTDLRPLDIGNDEEHGTCCIVLRCWNITTGRGAAATPSSGPWKVIGAPGVVAGGRMSGAGQLRLGRDPDRQRVACLRLPMTRASRDWSG